MELVLDSGLIVFLLIFQVSNYSSPHSTAAMATSAFTATSNGTSASLSMKSTNVIQQDANGNKLLINTTTSTSRKVIITRKNSTERKQDSNNNHSNNCSSENSNNAKSLADTTTTDDHLIVNDKNNNKGSEFRKPVKSEVLYDDPSDSSVSSSTTLCEIHPAPNHNIEGRSFAQSSFIPIQEDFQNRSRSGLKEHLLLKPSFKGNVLRAGKLNKFIAQRREEKTSKIGQQMALVLI